MRRILVLPIGPRALGVVTAELREADGSLIGVESRRTSVAVDVVHEGAGQRLVARPLELDLMGLTVRVKGFVIDSPPCAQGGDVPC